MKIQYVSKYISLSEEGLVPVLDCPMDQGPLFSNQTMDDEIFLYCLQCDYKKTIGTAFYHELVKKVNGAINGK
jgi:hypothetical protein